jgi:hypothetical protein
MSYVVICSSFAASKVTRDRTLSFTLCVSLRSPLPLCSLSCTCTLNLPPAPTLASSASPSLVLTPPLPRPCISPAYTSTLPRLLHPWLPPALHSPRPFSPIPCLPRTRNFPSFPLPCWSCTRRPCPASCAFLNSLPAPCRLYLCAGGAMASGNESPSASVYDKCAAIKSRLPALLSTFNFYTCLRNHCLCLTFARKALHRSRFADLMIYTIRCMPRTYSPALALGTSPGLVFTSPKDSVGGKFSFGLKRYCSNTRIHIDASSKACRRHRLPGTTTGGARPG